MAKQKTKSIWYQNLNQFWFVQMNYVVPAFKPATIHN